MRDHAEHTPGVLNTKEISSRFSSCQLLFTHEIFGLKVKACPKFKKGLSNRPRGYKMFFMLN